MHMIKTLALATLMATTAVGFAHAQSFIGGGTPDAQNGAHGRDQPSSFQGRDQMYSGRSAGYGYGYGYERGYGAPRHFYAPY